jgi:hypothetical protein
MVSRSPITCSGVRRTPYRPAYTTDASSGRELAARGIVEAATGLGVSGRGIVRRQPLVQRCGVEQLALGDVMEHPAQRPTAVGRQPVELVGAEPGRPLAEQTRGLVDAPQPRVEVRREQGQPVVGQRLGRAHPAVGGRRHDAVATPREPLIDLIQVIEGMVEHAPEDLARGVRVAARVARGAERRRPGVGEPVVQLGGHDRRDLARRIVGREPGEMLPGPGVRRLEVAHGIPRRRDQRPGGHHASPGGLRDDGVAVQDGLHDPVSRRVEGVAPVFEIQAGGHAVLLPFHRRRRSWRRPMHRCCRDHPLC